MAKSKTVQKPAGYQPAAEAVVNPADRKPLPTQQMTPTQSVTVTVDEVAMRIFTRIYMDTAGRTPVHLANSAFDAAETFIEVAESRKQN